MKNIKLTLSFDGKGFSGFQTQKNGKTVQAEIENALSNLLSEKISVTGVSRTDAGVHAAAYVLNFKTNRAILIPNVKKMLNNYFAKNKNNIALPIGEIYIKKAEKVNLDFNARYDAIDKTYLYRIGIEGIHYAFESDYIFHINKKLFVNKMKEAAKYLIGEHDFSSFKNSDGSDISPVKRIHDIKIRKAAMSSEFHTLIYPKKNVLEILIRGNGFLYNMVRIIVGTLIEIGANKRESEEMKEILNAKNRQRAGFTAPACGLYLYDVSY
ncbi:MAG: tRNA pseudouridine(38-40) synthase TruA [Clostridiales Family XIII bacterium]|jgi:tRNA pseudouridine38-40 synthase|nr:tRNA pseudouridine(38-40) synthase TruA [Clostridiales Family XIII bacterium]